MTDAPRLVAVDVQQRPPRMTLCFPGVPRRYITIRLRTDVQTVKAATIAARAEIEAFTPTAIELLRESATPGGDIDVGEPQLLAAAVRPVQREVTISGRIFCPRCGWKIGNADSPAIGYTRACNGCKRALLIERVDGCVVVTVSDS
jgi:NADH pyrophosphatase NudC (nudix superfamily)